MDDQSRAHQGRLLTVKEAAAFLAVSPRSLWALTNTGEIPSVRFGTGTRQSVRYDIDDLDAWIASRKHRRSSR